MEQTKIKQNKQAKRALQTAEISLMTYSLISKGSNKFDAWNLAVEKTRGSLY